jgi:GT2 family glycosyltransferase
MPPLVSIVTLFHKKSYAEEALRCVNSLRSQTIVDQIEIIAVNNASPDISDEELVQMFQPNEKLKLVHAKGNLGYGRANNLGAREATGEFVMIINPDNRLDPNALELMVQYLNEHADTGLVGAKLVFPDGTVRDSYRTFPNPFDLIIKRTPLKYVFKKRLRAYLQWDQDPHQTRTVDWVSGACFLMKRSLFEELGGFDERYFLFLEDCDLCRRVWEKNLKIVYLAEAIAHDQKDRLSAGGVLSFFTKKTVRIHVASAIKYFWKWKGKQVPQI